MRILFWSRTGNKLGGFEKYILLFAEKCRDRGHSFLLLNQIEHSSAEFNQKLKLLGSQQVALAKNDFDARIRFPNAFRVIRNFRPDVVQLHFISSPVIPILKLLGTPLVYQTYHSGIDHIIHPHTRLLRQLDNLFATRVFAVSERVRRDEIRAGVCPEKILMRYLGVPLKDFDPKKTTLKGRAPLGWENPELLKVITVGRFFPEKGMRDVVEAAVQVLGQREGIVWWLVGKEGTESDACTQMIDTARLRDRIDVLGQREDVPTLLNHSDLQVVGSRYEGFGLMALEAAVCGVPTVGPNIEGLDEIVLNEKTGLLVEPQSAAALAQSTIRLLDETENRLRLGASAKTFANQYFNAEDTIKNLLDLFEQDFNQFYQ